MECHFSWYGGSFRTCQRILFVFRYGSTSKKLFVVVPQAKESIFLVFVYDRGGLVEEFCDLPKHMHLWCDIMFCYCFTEVVAPYYILCYMLHFQ